VSNGHKLVVAFVLITCESGKERSIIEELEKLDTVKEARYYGFF